MGRPDAASGAAPDANIQTREAFSVNNKDKSSWAIGGTTIIGLGVGFIFLQTSALFFVASLLIGVGAGLVLVPIISRPRQ